MGRFSSSIGKLSFIAFLCVSTPVNSKSYEDVLALYRQGDFQASYQELIVLSSNNNAHAFYLLGRMVERGDGVPKNTSKAIAFYSKAASLGLDVATTRIAQLESKAHSVVLDWYLESAWDGDVESEYNLGYLYEMGMGVPIDETLALRWYEEAANQRHANAQLRLGLMLIAGVGEEVDMLAGEAWIIAAANNGNTVAKSLRNFFIQSDSDFDITRVVRGLRTLEVVDPNVMLSTLSDSIAQLKAVSSLGLLAEVKSVLSAPPAVISVPVQNVAPVMSQLMTDKSDIDLGKAVYFIPHADEDLTLSQWLTLYFIFLAMIIFALRKQLPSLTIPPLSFRRRSTLEMPEFAVPVMPNVTAAYEVKNYIADAIKGHQEKYIPVVGRSIDEKLSTLIPESIPRVNPVFNEFTEQALEIPLLTAEVNAPVSVDAAHKSLDEPSESKPLSSLSIKPFIQQKIDASIFEKPLVNDVVAAAKLPKVEKLSYADLMPQVAADIQMNLGNLTTVVAKAPSQKINDSVKGGVIVQGAVKVLRQSKLQEKIIKSLLQEKMKRPYVAEQVREFEASRVNNVNVVSEARFNLGMMFLRGEGVMKNIELAIKWFERSAEQGGEKAASILDQLYLEYPQYQSIKLGGGEVVPHKFPQRAIA